MKCEPTQKLSGYFKVPLIIIVTMCLFYPVGSQLDWIKKTGTFKYPVFFKSCKNFRLVQALTLTLTRLKIEILEMRVKVQRRVVNARDGSRAAIRPDRVKDGVAVVVRVWGTVRCRTEKMVGLTMRFLLEERTESNTRSGVAGDDWEQP